MFSIICFQFRNTSSIYVNQLISIKNNPAKSGNEGPCDLLKLKTGFPLSGRSKIINPAIKIPGSIRGDLSKLYFYLITILQNASTHRQYQ